MKSKKANKYKWVEAAIVVWTLVFVLAITAMAAQTSTYSCFQLSAESNGELKISTTPTGWTIKAYGTTSTGCNSTDSSETVTFTISNTDTARGVTFDISVTSGDASPSGAPSGSQTLAASGSLSNFTATSGKGSAAYTTINISITNIIQESTGAKVITTIKPTVGGTITVDGTTVTEQTDFENTDDHTYALTAKADTAAGYTFYGWVSAADGALNTDGAGTLSYAGQNANTLWPLFLKSDSAMYYIKGASPLIYYGYLNEAITAAGSSGTVVLYKSGTAYHSDSTQNSFTIPSGVTLLIPYDDANTLVTNGNAVVNLYSTDPPSVPTRTEYRSLTMASGAKITVASGGAISVSSGRANQFIGQVGPYGAIYMEGDSNITVQSGGFLYAWGYIFHGEEGFGTVTVESGGTVYEPISIMDYPGSADLATKLKTANVFPMRSYSLRNVEVPMTLNSGAKEYAFTCLYGSNPLVGTNPMYVLLVANGTVNGETPVFQNSGTITKSYVNGRMRMAFGGDLKLNSLTVEVAKSLGTMEISSGDTSGFYIPSCYDMTLTNGTITLNDNVIMCEGSNLTINEGATVNTNGKNIYVLDADNDPGAVSTINGCSIDVQDVHGNYYTNVPKDAVLDVNGTLIASGGFYTSAAGACITSSEGGGQIRVSGTSTSTTVKVKNTNAHTDVAITAAQLLNGDNSYTNTGASGANTYTYQGTGTDGRWVCTTHTLGAAATCTTAQTCTVCGTVLAAALGHTEVIDAAVDATCTTAGKSEGKHCSVCNEILVAQETIPALGHDWDEGEVTTEPTCTMAGIKTYTCGTCGDSYTEPVDATGHTSGAAATCTTAQTCTVCGTVLAAALGHTEVTDAAVAATCTEAGKTEGKHCSVCSEVLVAQEEVAALGHTEVTDAAVAATCTEAGKTEGKHCSVCNEVLVAQEEVPAAGHSYDAGVVTTAPTCTMAGIKTYTCGTCGETKTETISALGHNWSNGVCTVCGSAGAQVTLPESSGTTDVPEDPTVEEALDFVNNTEGVTSAQITVKANSDVECSIDAGKTVTLDLAGHAVSNITVAEGGTLTVIDSTTNGYGVGENVVDPGVLNGIEPAAYTNADTETVGYTYLRCGDAENGYSFNRFDITMTDYKVEAFADGTAKISFGAVIRGNTYILEALGGFGFKVNTDEDIWQVADDSFWDDASAEETEKAVYKFYTTVSYTADKVVLGENSVVALLKLNGLEFGSKPGTFNLLETLEKTYAEDENGLAIISKFKVAVEAAQNTNG